MEIFYLILKVSNLLDMTSGSRDEREAPPTERRVQRYLMMVGGISPL